MNWSYSFQESPNMRASTDTLNNDNSKPNDKGYYFIDRDGTLFRYVINFLRSSRLNLPKDFTEFDQLRSEARFYGLNDLEKAINVRTTICTE